MGAAQWWWVRLPRALGRRFVVLSLIAADGHVLVGLGRRAALLPPLAVLGGFVVGAAHPGLQAAPGLDETSFTVSLPLLIAVLAVGMLSTQLGAWCTIGFAVGDFFVNHTAWSAVVTFADPGVLSNPLVANLVLERVPLLIEYGLMASLAVGVPLGARLLAASVAQRLRLPEVVHLVVSTVLVALTAFVLARFWAASAPMVIRPVFTWTVDAGINQGEPPVGAIAPLQVREIWIARAAVLAVLCRSVLTWVLARAYPERVQEAERALAAPIEQQPAERGFLTALAQACLSAVIGVLFLAGLLEDLWVAVALGAVFVIARLVKAGRIPFPTRRWRDLVSRVPVLVRFGAVLLVINGIAKAVIALSLNTGDSFQFMVWPVAISVLLMAVMVPDPEPSAVAAAEPAT
jgi:hypothetical protein